MSLLNPKNLDLHLLRCLQTLIAEAHVTRAAERLDKTQPAMSVVLEPTLPLPDIEIAMYWHELLHNSAAHRWMRETMRATAERLEKGERS